MQIIVALLIFTFIVFVHELGHFTFAKLNGIGVEEFAIGMGKKIVSKKWGETIYSIRWLPIGGFCKMVGEDADSEATNAFNNKSPGARLITLFGGILFNIIIAIIFSMIFISINGQRTLEINEVLADSPASIANLQPGDTITHLNGESMLNYYDFSFAMSQNKGKQLNIQYKRDGEQLTVTLTPMFDKESQRYLVGFRPSELKLTPVNIFLNGFVETGFWVKMTYKSLYMLVSGQVSTREVAGPVGLVTMIGDGYSQSSKVSFLATVGTLSYFIVLISANLAVFNFLPIPALDGMRMVFVFIEILRGGKKIDANKEGFVHFVGFVMLMGLMVLVLFNDIARLFGV